MTDAAEDSRLLSGLDADLFSMLQGVNTSAFNNHGMGITPAHFETFDSLVEEYTVLRSSIFYLFRTYSLDSIQCNNIKIVPSEVHLLTEMVSSS